MKLTVERLREVLHYDAETGVWTWRVRLRGGVKAGDVAGFPDHGYLRISVDGKQYYSHRLTFLYMTGRWPVADMDHINGNKSDTRWANLREATRSQNNANMRTPPTNTSGYKGVTWDKSKRKWQAQITTCGRPRHLGRYDCPKAASAAYRAAAIEHFGEFARVA